MEYDTCRISALALTKMSRHAASGKQNEVMGMLIGSTFEKTFNVEDCFALPVEATETRVNAMGEAYEYIVEYLDSKTTNVRPQIVGWYHSHPGYGCFLSNIDIDTQTQNQQFQDPFVALVIDPNQTLAQNRVEIGAFRTKNNQFCALKVEYFANPDDLKLLTLLDTRTWAHTLARANASQD